MVAAFFLTMLGIMMESQPEFMALPACEGVDKIACVNTADECYAMCKGERAGGLFAGGAARRGQPRPSRARRRLTRMPPRFSPAAGFYIATAILAGVAWVNHSRSESNSSRRGSMYEMDDLNQSLLSAPNSH